MSVSHGPPPNNPILDFGFDGLADLVCGPGSHEAGKKLVIILANLWHGEMCEVGNGGQPGDACAMAALPVIAQCRSAKNAAPLIQLLAAATLGLCRELGVTSDEFAALVRAHRRNPN